MAERLQITIDGDSSGLNKALQSAENRLNSFNTRLTNSSRNLTRLMGTMRGMNTSMSDMIRAANSASAALNSAAVAANRFASSNQRISSTSQQARSNVGSLNMSFRNLILTIYSVRTLMFTGQSLFGGALRSVTEINAAYEKQLIMLENLSEKQTEMGRKRDAQRGTNFIMGMAEKAPFDIDSLQDTFVKLKVNGIDPTNGSMQTLLDTVAAFGGSSNNLKLATLAISQMASKGVVSMEELRRQLGEQVPSAIKAMAVGLGYLKNIHEENAPAMQKFYKEISKGAVDSSKAIPAMMKVLEENYKGSASRMMNTWDGQMARLQSAYKRMIIRLTESDGENSLFATLKKNVDQFTTFLNSKEGDQFVKDLQTGLTQLVTAFSQAAQFVWKYREELITLAKVVVTLMVFRTAAGWVRDFVGAVSTTITFIRRLSEIQTGTRLVTLLFGTEVRRAAGALGLFNANGTISISAIARLAAVGTVYYAGLKGIIWAQEKANSLFAVQGQVSREVNQQKEVTTKLNKEIQKDLDKEIAKTKEARAEQLKNLEVDKMRIQERFKLVKVLLASAAAELAAAKAKEATALAEYNKANEFNYNQGSVPGIIGSGPGKAMGERAASQAARKNVADKAASFNVVAKQNNDLIQQFNQIQEKIETIMEMDAPAAIASKGGKVAKDKLGDLDGTRSQLVSLMMQVKALQAELNGPAAKQYFEDHNEAIIEQVEAQAKAITSQKVLNDKIREFKGMLPGLRTDVRNYNEAMREHEKQLEKLKDLEEEVANETVQASEALGQLSDSYTSVTAKLARYNAQLRDRYKEELASKDVTIQNQALADIDAALIQRRIKLLADEAAAVRDKRREIEDSFLTESEQADVNYQREQERVQGLIAQVDTETTEGKILYTEYYKYLEALRRKWETQKNPFAKWALENRDIQAQMGSVLTSSLDGFVDQLAQGKFAFKDFATSLLADLAKVIIRALIAKAILSAIGMGGGSINTSSVDAGTFSGVNMSFNTPMLHTGGLVGGAGTGMSKSVSAGMFAFAKRYHSGGFPGLADNEVPIIAEKGEGVFTKEQMKALGGGVGGGTAPNTTVNVINQTGVQADAEQSQPRWDGESYVIDVVLKNMNKPGPMRDAMKGMK